jgi:hypothetical protein
MLFSEVKVKDVQIAPGFQIKAFEATGWGWTGNENSYGLVVWPGARVVAKAIVELPDILNPGSKVVELGAGSGLCSLVCAAKGASVLATDLNTEPLELAKAAAEQQGLSISTRTFDILGAPPLPPCDLLLLADCIYTPELGRGVARRVLEAKARGALVLMGSSVNRPGYKIFLDEARRAGLEPSLRQRRLDFSSPLLLLDLFRGNYVQEITVW